MEHKLLDDGSNHANLLLEIVQNVQKIGADVTTHQEDVLITNFVELLLMPFIRGIPNTIVHGNGHTLEEPHVRKIKFAKQYGLPTKVVRGRAPDRTVVFDPIADQPFAVLVMEVKTTDASAKYPDFVKLASEMRDVFDFATSKGVNNYKTTGVLIAGATCKLYSLHMPIDDLNFMTEVATFCMPNNIGDEILVEMIQKIAEPMLTCVSNINESITK